MSEMSDACEVPLIELLRSIPREERIVLVTQRDSEGRETGHRYIPVGILAHRAANELADRLNVTEENARIRAKGDCFGQ